MTEMQQGKATERRPLVIQLFCGLGFLMIGFPLMLLLPAVRDPLVAQYGANEMLIFAASSLVTFIAALGCWRMRKWGVYVYALVPAMRFMSDLVTDGIQSAVLSSLVPLIVAVLLFAQLKRMS